MSGRAGWSVAAAAVALVLGCASDGHRPPVDPDDPRFVAALKLPPLEPLPPDPTNAVADDPRAAVLGQALFFDRGLSANGSTSCASCHEPELAFADGRTLARAAGTGPRNTPTVLDSARNRWFYRDGRADTAWAQAVQPIEDTLEMASDRVAVVHHLRGDEQLTELYTLVFGEAPAAGVAIDALPEHARPVPADPADPLDVAWRALPEATRHAVDLTLARVGKALAAYERQLVFGPGAMDRWVASVCDGDLDGGGHLSDAAVRGLLLFTGEAGCLRCHGGPRLSDGGFHNLGVPPLGGGAPSDPGRYEGLERLAVDPFNAAGPYSDAPDGARARDLPRLPPPSAANWGAFHTPPLRGVADTAPYMHAGQLSNLAAVVRFYSTLDGAVGAGHHGESTLQPLDLSEEQQADLVAFLLSLDGAHPDPRWHRPPRREELAAALGRRAEDD